MDIVIIDIRGCKGQLQTRVIKVDRESVYNYFVRGGPRPSVSQQRRPVIIRHQNHINRNNYNSN